MTDQKQSKENVQQTKPHHEQESGQNRPSHMNQGNETFRPDQQKGERRENQKSGQPQEPARKAS